MNPIEQQFFNDLEKKLWTAADKLRSNLDAAVYKHVVLGLIFLKYVSDAFEERQKELREQFQNPAHDYYMAPEDYADDYEGHLATELEVRDYYTEKNVFWVPLEARWQTLRDCAQLPPKAPLPWNKTGKDEPEEMRSVGWLIDNAMEAIERENEKKLKNVLNKDFARTQIDSHKLADLIAHFSDTDFNRKDYNGHRRFDWSLMPTLGRLTTNGIVTEQLAQAQLERFKRAVRGRLNDAAMVDEDDELWSVGQHHGLMTPLLDWTYSPYVALFFAFHKDDSKEEAANPYRAVYVLNKSFLTEHEDETGIRLWEPRRDDHGRLVNQAGLFTFSPTDATIENKLANVLADDDLFDDEELRAASEDEQPDILARYICKIYIRNEERDACLRHLRRMNVHHASLFPDLLGASEYCNVITTEAEMAAAVQQRGKHIELTITESVTATDQMDAEVTPSSASTATLTSIEDVLRLPAGAEQVEPGRIALMAEELAASIARNKVVDWETRDAVQARLRNVVRVVLRKYGYPQALREQVVERVMTLAKLDVVIDGGTF